MKLVGLSGGIQPHLITVNESIQQRPYKPSFCNVHCMHIFNYFRICFSCNLERNYCRSKVIFFGSMINSEKKWSDDMKRQIE
jgi:hypothetical protein